MKPEFLVGVLDFKTLKKYVLNGEASFKILAPTINQIIYYGMGNLEGGMGINHLRMLDLLPSKLSAREVGFAADLTNRPIRPPTGITVYPAGETLKSLGYQIDRNSVTWVMGELNKWLQINESGVATLE